MSLIVSMDAEISTLGIKATREGLLALPFQKNKCIKHSHVIYLILFGVVVHMCGSKAYMQTHFQTEFIGFW